MIIIHSRKSKKIGSCYFYVQNQIKRRNVCLPCPHYDIKIVQRSNHQSAVASAAYQSGERLFSEYDQKQKYYSHKSEIVYKEVLLPVNAPTEYKNRNVLWNSVEAVEKQWNSQLARRIVLAIPREIPREQYADLIRDYCQNFFVSKGMCCDFAVHDKGDGNPHAHILLTMRAFDENGKWLPKSRKIYDFDENGNRIRLPSGSYKSHKENTVDWNEQKYAEIWRQDWADTANKYLEANNRSERLDLHSYIRQGKEQIPTVHMGSAVCQMEKRGIKTNIGNLNRDIKDANSLMQSIRHTIRHLKGWIADLKEKKQAIIENEQKEETLQQLLTQYLSIRKEERNSWSYYGKTKGNTIDLKKIASITAYLQETKIFTLESLDKHLETVNSKADSIRQSMKLKENKIKNINVFFRHISNYEKYKAIYTEYNNIHWKGRKQKFAEIHKEELNDFKSASAYFKKYPDKKTCNCQELIKERKQLEKELEKETEALTEIQTEVKKLRDIRFCVNKVLEEKTEKKTSVLQQLKENKEQIKKNQTEKYQAKNKENYIDL